MQPTYSVFSKTTLLEPAAETIEDAKQIAEEAFCEEHCDNGDDMRWDGLEGNRLFAYHGGLNKYTATGYHFRVNKIQTVNA
jgi:hypothetical protein